MVRMMRKKILTVLASVLLVLGVAQPAAADSGWFYDSVCNSWTDPYTHARYKGYATIYGPGSSYAVHTGYTPTWSERNVKGTEAGGWWSATATVDVDSPSTYAYCGDGSP